MTSWRATDRTSVVQVACLLATALAVASTAIGQRDLGAVEVRIRIIVVSQASTPATGLLLVLAAAAAVRSGRGRRLVQVVGAALTAMALAAAYSYATLSHQPTTAAGWRIGIAAYYAASGVLAAFAVWLAAQSTFSGVGSPPGEGTA